MSGVQTSGEWREERLYVLQTIEDLRAELRRQSEAAAVERTVVIEKGARDIKAAHDKIRALESAHSSLKLKNWIMAGLLGAVRRRLLKSRNIFGEAMNFPLSAEVIAGVLTSFDVAAGTRVNVDQVTGNVRANWPLVEAALDRRGIYSPLTAVGAIATIGVETGRFSPIKEGGGPTYLTNLYEDRKDLGNTQAGDGVRFRGRGFVQITGRANYTHFGAEIGRDLVADPDAALDPAVAADILALFFHERQVDRYANQQNWEMVRRRVNGGLNNFPRFIDAVQKLRAALNNPPPAAGTLPEVS